jgi:hypothetical protein
MERGFRQSAGADSYGLGALHATACVKQGVMCNRTDSAKIQQKDKMNTENLSNSIVKSAIDALQKGDKSAWYALFAHNAEMTDDGNTRNFKKFSDDAIGHERFTSIDKVENDGKDIYGHFHSDQWGDFKTYFKFHINAEGKITKLEIGQVN